MFHLLPDNKLTKIQKICLAGLLIALATILQKVVAINYISLIPFVRVSFGGCALIILSSVILGPWYGLFIGAFSDILGYFIFDPKTLGFFPQITAIYALLGFSSYFIFALVRKISNEKLIKTIEYGTFIILFIAVTLFVTLNNQITLYSSTYTIELWQKITIPCVLFALFIFLVVITYLIDKHFKKQNNENVLFTTHQISFSCFIIELLVMVLFGTVMKGCAFGFQTYLVILIAQIIVAFVNIPLNTLIINYSIVLLKKLNKLV